MITATGIRKTRYPGCVCERRGGGGGGGSVEGSGGGLGRGRGGGVLVGGL